MNLLKKFRSHCRKQQKFYSNNLEKAEQSNKSIVKSFLCIGCAAFTLFLPFTLFTEHFRAYFFPYLVEDAILLVFLIFSKWLLEHIPPIIMIYAISANLLGFCIYTNISLVTNTQCVIALFLFAILPLITLDKMWRIHLMLGLYLALYLGISLPFQDTPTQMDEIVNCLLATGIGAWLGNMLRFIRLEHLELRRLSTVRESIDELTGLFNRRCLFKSFMALESRASKNHIAGLMIVDIDWFKSYNDTYGHQAGDRCLRRIADCLRTSGRDYGLTFYRYGGEEFVGISNGRTPLALEEVARRLTRAAAALRIKHEGSPLGVVTVSIGAALRADVKEHAERRLLSDADTALYAAKAGGRNRALLFAPGMEAEKKGNEAAAAAK